MTADRESFQGEASWDEKKSSSEGRSSSDLREKVVVVPEANIAIQADRKSIDEKRSTDGKAEGHGDTTNDDDKYLTGLPLVVLLVAVLAAVFIVALSNTIISTAIPTLTTVFNSYDDIAWYTSGEQLTATAFQLPFGRAYAFLNLKWTFLGSLLVYLLGSLVCAVAPSSFVLILGRAIAGIGNAGVFTGVFVIIARSVALRKRALYAGLIGATFAIAAVLGPIVGGLFTEDVTWRWCFYINLPIGAVSVAIIVFFMPVTLGRASKDLKSLTWWQYFLKFDPFGSVLVLASTICLLLALQWGGAEYPWSNWRVITVFVVFGLTLIVWLVVQYFQGEEATVPGSVAKQRTVAGASLYSVILSAAVQIVIYFVPIWYQSVQGDSPKSAGIKQVSLVIGLSLFAIIGGGVVAKTGYYVPIIICGTIFSSVGAGLLYTIDLNTGLWRILGYQFIFAAGIGLSLEQCNVAVQTVLPDNKIPQGTSLILFARGLGTAIAGPIAQSVLQQGLYKHFGRKAAAEVFNASGATDTRANLERIFGKDTAALRVAFRGLNDSVTRTFLVALVLACLTVLVIPLIEWKDVKKEGREEDDRREGKKPNKNKKEDA
ncbi:hypothetical protein LTR37_008370 [Vermiconidia calcicola]|uniref:Uncharacterized protein n=1 Tax=Vermiconidia calcicola TaxID=1690605 RepID=A0ACC3NAW8_9PEZI|nr:hypothetical protein LTR37_008370 [Vermiconidia calcicola]